MLNSFSRLTDGGLRCERHLTDEAERHAEIQGRNAPPRKGGMSDEAVTEMIEKLHLL